MDAVNQALALGAPHIAKEIERLQAALKEANDENDGYCEELDMWVASMLENGGWNCEEWKEKHAKQTEEFAKTIEELATTKEELAKTKQELAQTNQDLRESRGQVKAHTRSVGAMVDILKGEVQWWENEYDQKVLGIQEEMKKLKSEKQEAMEPWLGDNWDQTTLADWADDIETQKAEITSDFEGQIEELKEEIRELQTDLEGRADEVEDCCTMGCEKEASILTKRDSGYHEWTCAECHKDQYPELYEEDDE